MYSLLIMIPEETDKWSHLTVMLTASTDCTLLAVASSRKSIWRYGAVKTFFHVKKGPPGPVGFQPLIPKAKFLASPFLPPISLEARRRRHSHSSPPPPPLHLRKTLAADPSNPSTSARNRGPNRARARQSLAGPVEISGRPFFGWILQFFSWRGGGGLFDFRGARWGAGGRRRGTRRSSAASWSCRPTASASIATVW
jgi:hypothetical protein